MSLTLHIHTGHNFDPKVKLYPVCPAGPFAAILLDPDSGASLYITDPEHAERLIDAAREAETELRAALARADRAGAQ